MDKFNTNPFDRSALTDSKLLAARNNELRQIRFLLRNAFKQDNRIKSIMICGDRGVGKTSFLNLIEIDSSANNIIPIRLNLTESNSQNSNEFFWYLFSQTINTLFGIGLLGGQGGDIQNAIQKIIISDGLSDIINWVFKTPILRKNYLTNRNSTFEFDLLMEDLKLLRKQVVSDNNVKFNSKTKFLFLVDESQNIYSNTKIIEEIRFIIQSQEIGFGFVFAGDTSFEKSQWDIVFGGTHREFEIIRLDYFEDVDCVKEYFRKSLESIDWTTKEIEEDLFYRFSVGCSQIYALTSGKPAWINEIAEKMFERCMKGEANILKFDRNAQNDVKNILLSSGQIDKVKLDFIDSLPTKFQKWIAKIFASELSTLNQVYFYSKFISTGENLLSLDEYRVFCEKLFDAGILVLGEDFERRSLIGYNSQKRDNDFLDKPYIAFGANADSIKLWLQINTDGRFGFRIAPPYFTFINFINTELCMESGNVIIMGSDFQENYLSDVVRFTNFIAKINNGTFDIVEVPYNYINVLYKLFKRLTISKIRQILFIKLIDNISNKTRTWNIYNTNEHNKLIGFNNNSLKIQRLKSNVEYYNNLEHSYSLEIFIDNVLELNIEKFQNLIIQSGDSKKRNIVIEDKMDSLVKYYIDEHNVDSSYSVACFIYNLFEEGHDLSIRHLNNTAYIFIVKNEFEKVKALLKEAIKKIENETIGTEETGSAALVIYNMAVVAFEETNFDNALKLFQSVLVYCEEHETLDDKAGALFVVEENKDEIVLKEIQANERKLNSLSIKSLTKENILILKKHLLQKI